jgi:predicted ATP-grasp superfamily ATP-dependent carboligase
MVTASLDTRYPVRIIKASRETIHHGVLGIARTLGRLGIAVYAVVEDRLTPLAVSRYLTKSFVWETWPGEREALLNAMSAIGEYIGLPTILIPVDDLSAVCVAENASALGRWFILPQLARDLPRQLADKASLYSLCHQIGIPCAKSIVPRSAADVDEFVKHTTFPVVVKAAEQWRLLNGRHNAVVLPTRESLSAFCQSVDSEERSRMILQEYIPGEDWIYHGYANSATNLYLGFTGKKLLGHPPDAGSTAMGASLRNETLASQCERLLRAVAYSGITDMDWRKDERDGQYKILDCNPRVGMNFRMFETSEAIDVVRAQHLDLTGRSFERGPMIEGRLFTAESFYFLAWIRGGRRNAMRSEGLNRSLRKCREFAWWSSDDRRPFFVMSVRLLLRTMRRAFRSIWNRGDTRPIPAARTDASDMGSSNA